MSEFKLGVYRLLDDRFLPWGSPEAKSLEWQRHNERRQALEALFAESPEMHVRDWGDTKDELHPHEWVQVSIDVLSQSASYVAVPAIAWLGKKLAESIIDQSVAAAIKVLVSRLRPHQEAHRVADFQILTADGTSISVDPPDRSGKIIIRFADGAVDEIEYICGGDDGS